LQAVIDSVNALVRDADIRGTIVQCKDRILALLLDSGLAVKQWLSPDNVAVHPLNRDNYGVNPKDCHALMKDIFSLGWSFEQVHAVAVEIASEEERLKTYDFNRILCQGSAGLLPAATPADQIKAASVTCGHTNSGLRAIRARVCCEYPELSMESQFSPEKIRLKDSEFGRAIDNGLQWTVISAKVVLECPGLVTMLQAAGNAPGQIQKAENEIQVMMRLHATAKTCRDAAGQVDWQRVLQVVSRTKPPCLPDLPDLVQFVAKKAGTGDDAFLLHELEQFHKMHVPTNHVVKGGFYSQLAAFELSPTAPAPFWTMACLKTQYSCPASKVRSGECKFISATDLKNCTAVWKKDVEKVESLMKECRAKLHLVKDDLTDAQRTHLLGLLDVRLVSHVMNKKDKGRPSFGSLEEICHTLVQELQAMTPLASQIASPWSSASASSGQKPAQPEQAAPPSDDNLKFTDFNTSGELADPMELLRNKGVHVGGMVRPNGSDKIHHVIEMQGGFVKLQPQPAQKCVSVSIDKFLEAWQVVAHTTAVKDEEHCNNITCMRKAIYVYTYIY
jgi:hypothetical protein